jgi:superfamily II DNA or RNA helicase
MSLILETPTVLRVEGHSRQVLERLLTYRDKSVDFELQKFKKSAFYHRRQLGIDGYEARLAELKAAQKQCLLYEDEKGLFTLSGFANLLENRLGDKVQRGYDMPCKLELTGNPGNPPRPYQQAGDDALLLAKHAAVEVGTGLGKSLMAEVLERHLGLQLVLMAPSKNIAEQLYDAFVGAFGKAKVGFFGDGKHEFTKLITVAIAASLTRIEEGTAAWNALSKAKVFIADESHLTAAKTLKHVCLGLMANAPYRFFFSGTQLRADGKDLLLEGITGPVVFRMTVREGVDQGYLAKPFFRIVNVGTSKPRYYSQDANRMTAAHLFYNDEVVSAAALIANMSVSQLNQQVLVLVEEYEQFARLLPHLRHEVEFAHATLTKENLQYVPERYQKVDNKALVNAFNARKFPILVGTSCISTGTDIQPVENLIYLCGGKSEVQVRQACGRGTRMIPGQGKTCFNFTDFRVHHDGPDGGPGIVERHLEARKEIFEDIYPGTTTEVRL